MIRSASFFRFTSGSVGIYEAVERDCPRNDPRRVNKPDGSWLPKVGPAHPGAISYWTETGLQRYLSSGLLDWHLRVVRDPIFVLVAESFESILHSDEFQVICNPESPRRQSKLGWEEFRSGYFNVSAAPHRELQSSKTGEKYSLSAPLSKLVGLKDVFVHHEIIPAGRRASALHSHSHREEMIFVLEGTPTAHIDGKEQALKPGDFMGFLPCPEHVHFVRNDSDSPARVLVIASNPRSDEGTYA